MSVILPSSVFTRFGQAIVWLSFDGDNRTQAICVYPVAGERVELPSFFSEQSSLWEGNDVCHIKTLDVRPSCQGKPILIGYSFGATLRGKADNITSAYYGTMLSSHEYVLYSTDVTVDTSRNVVWTFSGQRFYTSSRISQGTRQRRYNITEFYVTYKILSNDTLSFMYSSGDSYVIAHVKVLMTQTVRHPSYALIREYNEARDTILPSLLSSFQTAWWPDPTFSGRDLPDDWLEPCVIPPLSSVSPDMLLLDEFNLTRYGYSGRAFKAYHLKAMMQDAYLDALDKVPQFNENSIANILEIVGFLKGIIIDHRIEIPKSLSSAWLMYRYQYNTTKLDVEEAVSFVYRNVDKDFLVKGFSCYGSSSRLIEGQQVTLRCHLSMKEKELSYLDKIFTGLYRYGLSPSFYVIWDMIPYSFIVDWFIPVGDILSGYDTTRMYDRTYDISDIWYSLKYHLNVSGQGYDCYTRWAAVSPPEYQGYYTLENKGTASDKVIGYRILDTLSLIFS